MLEYARKVQHERLLKGGLRPEEVREIKRKITYIDHRIKSLKALLSSFKEYH